MKTLILEERGYFWWHGEPIQKGHFAPESSVTGILKIDAEGQIELELDNLMPSDKPCIANFFNKENSLSLNKSIQGILKNSNKFTLLDDVIQNGGHWASKGISYEKYTALNCLVGTTPFSQTVETLRFNNIQVSLKGFEEWLRLGSIKLDRTESDISAKHELPKNISYPLDEGTLSIEYDISGPYFGKHSTHNLTLSEEASICYTPKQSSSLEEMRTLYGLIEDLFILLTDSNYNLDWPMLSHEQGDAEYQFYFPRSRNTAIAPRWHECLTNFIQLHKNFGQIFSSWKKKHQVLGPGFYLYLGTRRGIDLYAEHRFVNLIWGIESLHRKKEPSLPISGKLQKKIERILVQIDGKKDKEWLESRLKHAGEPTLDQRIFETFKDLPLDIDAKSLRKFASACAHSRNDISHFGGQRIVGDYEDFILDLVKKSDAISYLYHTLILNEIGVDKTILNEWMYKGFHSGRIKATLTDVGLLTRSP